MNMVLFILCTLPRLRNKWIMHLWCSYTSHKSLYYSSPEETPQIQLFQSVGPRLMTFKLSFSLSFIFLCHCRQSDPRVLKSSFKHSAVLKRASCLPLSNSFLLSWIEFDVESMGLGAQAYPRRVSAVPVISGELWANWFNSTALGLSSSASVQIMLPRLVSEMCCDGCCVLLTSSAHQT